MGSVSGNGREYFLIVLAKDKVKLPHLKFKPSETYRGKLVERELNQEEIKWFKSRDDEFVKIIHSTDGRVYELKSKSFKNFYNDNIKSRSH